MWNFEFKDWLINSNTNILTALPTFKKILYYTAKVHTKKKKKRTEKSVYVLVSTCASKKSEFIIWNTEKLHGCVL